MAKPVHSDLIKAWADGAEIEIYLEYEDRWYVTNTPRWNADSLYRIKPEAPKPIVREMFVEANPTLDNAYNKPNLRLTFHPENGKIIDVEIIGD